MISVRGLVSQQLEGVVGDVKQQLLQKLSTWASVKDFESSLRSEILDWFASDLDWYDQQADQAVQISQERALDLVERIKSASRQSIAAGFGTDECVGFTDQYGYNYLLNLVDINYQGKQILLSSSAILNSPEDQAILYMENGKYYLKQIIPTTDSVFSNLPALSGMDTIMGCLRLINSTLGNSASFRNVRDGLAQLNMTYQSLYANVQPGHTVLEYLQGRVIALIASQPLHSTYGSLVSTVKDVLESTTLNEVITSVIHCFEQGVTNIANILATVRATISTAKTAVQNFIDVLQSGYNKGGLYGMMMAVYNYINGQQSVIPSDSAMSFTDNANYRASLFLAGAFWTIGSTVASVIGGVLTAAIPIVGVALAAVGTVFSWIGSAVSYAFNEQTVCLYTPEQSYPMFAIAYDQHVEQVTDAEVYQNFSTGEVFLFAVPGGYVLLWHDPSTAEGSLSYEFHPAVAEYSASIPGINVRFDAPNNLVTVYTVGTVQVSQSMLKDIWDHRSASNINPKSDGSLETADSARLALIALKNTALWLCFNSTQGSYNVPYISYSSDDIAPVRMARRNGTTGVWSFFLSEKGIIGWIVADYSLFSSYSSDYINDGWSSIVDTFIDDAIDVSLQRWFLTAPFRLAPSNLQWTVIPPKYTKIASILAMVVGAALTVAATAITVVGVLKIRKAIKRQKLQNTARVESAYEAAKETTKTATDPETGEELIVAKTPEELKAGYDNYYKTAKKANFQQMFIGGTKYDLTNYWMSDIPSPEPSDSEAGVASSVSEMFQSIPLNLSSNVSDSDTPTVTLNDIYTKITGITSF